MNQRMGGVSTRELTVAEEKYMNSLLKLVRKLIVKHEEYLEIDSLVAECILIRKLAVQAEIEELEAQYYNKVKRNINYLSTGEVIINQYKKSENEQ